MLSGNESSARSDSEDVTLLDTSIVLANFPAHPIIWLPLSVLNPATLATEFPSSKAWWNYSGAVMGIGSMFVGDTTVEHGTITDILAAQDADKLQ